MILLEFDAPCDIRGVRLEIEEAEAERTQELLLDASSDGGKTYRELVRQEFNFAPAGSTFEREEWTFAAEKTTHFRLHIKPDKAGRPCHASLTTLALR